MNAKQKDPSNQRVNLSLLEQTTFYMLGIAFSSTALDHYLPLLLILTGLSGHSVVLEKALHGFIHFLAPFLKGQNICIFTFFYFKKNYFLKNYYCCRINFLQNYVKRNSCTLNLLLLLTFPFASYHTIFYQSNLNVFMLICYFTSKYSQYWSTFWQIALECESAGRVMSMDMEPGNADHVVFSNLSLHN